MRQLADIVRRYIPDARIEFGAKAPPENQGDYGLPWRASCDLAREDLGFNLMSLEEAVLIHINDARLEAGLPPIKG